MADNVSVHNQASGTGTSIPAATDEIGGVHYQRIKTTLGPDGTATADQAGRDLGGGVGGAAYVDPRPDVARIQVTQTVAATAHAAKDAVGGLMTFSNAARVAGGPIHIEACQVRGVDQQLVAYDLILFAAAPATVTDDAAFDPTDAELLDCVGVIPIATDDWHDLNDNAVAHVDVSLTAKLTTTTLYGVLVARGAPTFASTTGPTVTLTMVRD